jgi:hypothetical protein
MSFSTQLYALSMNAFERAFSSLPVTSSMTTMLAPMPPVAEPLPTAVQALSLSVYHS